MGLSNVFFEFRKRGRNDVCLAEEKHDKVLLNDEVSPPKAYMINMLQQCCGTD